VAVAGGSGPGSGFGRPVQAGVLLGSSCQWARGRLSQPGFRGVVMPPQGPLSSYEPMGSHGNTWASSSVGTGQEHPLQAPLTHSRAIRHHGRI